MTYITNQQVRDMVRPWLTGDDEKDARMLQSMFRGARMTIDEWRQVVCESLMTPCHSLSKKAGK